MKITRLRTLCLSRLHEVERQWITARYRTIKADCAIVIVETDGGLTGIGEASAYGVPTLIRDWVEWLSPLLIGRDPLDPGLAPHPNGRRRAYDCAVAGIDTALWDLRGKAAGKRVSELLADRPLERVRLYASSGCRYDWRNNPESLVDEVLGYVAEGYTACKIRIGTEWSWDGVNVDRFLGLMRELTQAVGGRLELMLDGNQRLTEEQALEIAHELDMLGFTWFEEPIPQTDIDGYMRLNQAVELPITGGEQYATLEQFRPYLERGAYSIVQPDVGVSGIGEMMRIAQFADQYGVDFCPHSWHNGLMCVAHAHIVAAISNPRVVEMCMIQGPLQWGILAGEAPIENGHLVFTDRPGLGVDLGIDLEARFPYVEGHYAITVDR